MRRFPTDYADPLNLQETSRKKTILRYHSNLKKAVSILLLGIFLFNLGGYRMVFHFANQKADQQIQAQLDNDSYNENELVVLKMPMSVPYYSGTAGFEYTQGEVTLDGVIYRYVKKRVVNDTIEMYCIPHETKMELMNARDMFAKLSTDFINGSKEQHDAPVKTTVKPFVLEWFEEHNSAFSIPVTASVVYAACAENNIPAPYLQPGTPPPDSVI